MRTAFRLSPGIASCISSVSRILTATNHSWKRNSIEFLPMHWQVKIDAHLLLFEFPYMFWWDRARDFQIYEPSPPLSAFQHGRRRVHGLYRHQRLRWHDIDETPLVAKFQGPVVGTCWKRLQDYWLVQCTVYTFENVASPTKRGWQNFPIQGLSPVLWKKHYILKCIICILWYHTEGSILKPFGSNNNSCHLSTKSIEDHEWNSLSLPIEAMAISWLI